MPASGTTVSKTQIAMAESKVSEQVPADRRQEILDYLSMFGYKPDSTIIQVHITGFFSKRGAAPPRLAKMRESAAKRYRGTTFIVVGRTHDPRIMDEVIRPRKKPGEASPGYVGYLWRNRDSQNRPPHEVIPLDFTPVHLPYPADWKNMFATKGFLLAMHVPSAFAKQKSGLTRQLYQLGKKVKDTKEPWTFLKELEKFSYKITPQIE